MTVWLDGWWQRRHTLRPLFLSTRINIGRAPDAYSGRPDNDADLQNTGLGGEGRYHFGTHNKGYLILVPINRISSETAVKSPIVLNSVVIANIRPFMFDKYSIISSCTTLPPYPWIRFLTNDTHFFIVYTQNSQQRKYGTNN